MKSHKNYYAAAGRNGLAVAGNYDEITRLFRYLGAKKRMKGFAGIEQAIDWAVEEYNLIQGSNLAKPTDFSGCGDLILTKNLIQKCLAEK